MTLHYLKSLIWNVLLQELGSIMYLEHNISCNITVHNSFHLIQLLVYIPVFFVGTTLNGLALWIFCYKINRWTETRVYMTNLVMADGCLLFTLPFKMVFSYNQQQVDTWCLIVESAYFINRLMSIYIITIVAIDRYITVKYPLKAKGLKSPFKAATISACLWILIICLVGITKAWENREQPGICFEPSGKPSRETLLACLLGFFIPLIILSFCSVQVIKKLVRKRNTTAHEEKLIQKAIYIISANMIVFLACFFPVYTGHIVQFIVNYTNAVCSVRSNVNNFVHLASLTANTNCCLDAICYYFVSQEFQEATSLLQKSNASKSMTYQRQM